MKKNNKKSKSLKRYKEELDSLISNNDEDQIIKCLDNIIKDYPNNIYGYNKKIEYITKSYTKYINQDLLRELKQLNDVRINLASKKNKDLISKEFNEYLDDISEANTLEKIKKDIITNVLKKSIINDKLNYLNSVNNNLNTYRIDGKKILDFYDLIKGIFLTICLIFNIIYNNILLIITIPFGIYGLSIIYNYFTTNLTTGMLLKKKKDKYSNVRKLVKAKKDALESKLEKVEQSINFNIEQKKSVILRLPKLFKEDLNDLYTDNEGNISNSIKEVYISGNIEKLSDDLNEHTSENIDSFSKFVDEISEFDEEISTHIGNKESERKTNQTKLLVMNDIKKWNIVLLIILLVISVLSSIVIAFNFYDLNLKSFIIALIIGIISMCIYNINKGKSTDLLDTFNDNLISTIFNATLTYNLAYSSITKDIKLIYNFIEIPIIFTFILIGFVMLISFLKYNNYKKRLRK